MFRLLNTKTVCAFLVSTTILVANFGTCVAQQQTWHVYGIDPYNPKQPSPQVRFTPLQIQSSGIVTRPIPRCTVAPSFGNVDVPHTTTLGRNEVPWIEYEQTTPSLGVISNEPYLGVIGPEYSLGEYPTNEYAVGNSLPAYSLAPGEYVISEDPPMPSGLIVGNPLEVHGELTFVPSQDESLAGQSVPGSLPSEQSELNQSADGPSVLSSPSDVAVADPDTQPNSETKYESTEIAPGTPDLVGPTSVVETKDRSEASSAELDAANEMIAALEEKLVAEISKSRSASERAYAAEKAAKSANQNAAKSLSKMKKDNTKKANAIAADAIEKLEAEMKSLEENLANRQQEKDAANRKQVVLEKEKARMQEEAAKLAKQKASLEDEMKMAQKSAEEASKRAILAMEQANRQLDVRKQPSHKASGSDQSPAAEAVQRLQRQAKRSGKSRAVNRERERARHLAAEKREADEKAAEKRTAEKKTDDKRAARRKEIERRVADAERKAIARVKAAKLEAEANVAATLAAREKAMEDAQKESEMKAQKKSDKKDADREKSKGDSKKRRGKTSPTEQIKKLQASMERQIKKSKDNITKRSQSRIAQLKKNGKKDSDSEIIKLKEKLESDIEDNEKMIRDRIEERIKRLRKETAARSKS